MVNVKVKQLAMIGISSHFLILLQCYS